MSRENELVAELLAEDTLLCTRAAMRIAALEEALTRLASPEAFEMSRMATKEETARMLFAEAALLGAKQ